MYGNQCYFCKKYPNTNSYARLWKN